MTTKSICQQVRVFRKHIGLTLPELAVKSGVSKGCLSKIENGKGNPTIETLLKIYGAMGLSYVSPLPKKISTLYNPEKS